MANGFNLGNLTAYVDQHTEDLIGKLLWAGDSLKYFKKVPHVQGTVAINYFDINPEMQVGFCAGINPSGGTTLYQRNLTVCDIKYEDNWCITDLQKYWMTENLKPVGVGGESMGSFEELFMQQLTNKILQTTETNVWQNTDYSGTCLGLYHRLLNDQGRHTVSGGTTVTSSNIIPLIAAMINNLPLNISQMDDLQLFAAPSLVWMFQQAMFSNNNFGMPLIDKNNDIVINFLGPKITIHSTYGLAGTSAMVLTTLKNLYYGFDQLSDVETCSVWYERKDDQIYTRVKHRMGVQFWDADYTVCNF